MSLTVVFDRGTLRVAGADELLPFTQRDAATGELRAPAHRFGDLAAYLDACGRGLQGDLRRSWGAAPRPIDDLGLRPYQEEALASWEAFGRRGVVALPTGAGKTRVAIAAMRATGLPALVLCPTRALLAAWADELATRLGEAIGVVGDGKRRIERVTVMTFESGFRHLSDLGDRFGLLVVDEVHHFAGGIRSEALEACAAPARLGLSATAPRAGTEGAERLSALVGPVVYEVGVRALVGRHLAELSVVPLHVQLAEDERAAYEKLVEPLKQIRRAWFRANRHATYAAFVRAMSADETGRRAMRAYARGLDIAYFPREKRAMVRALLARHRADRTIVFTARTEDAYRVATDSLIPVITAEVSAAERARILARFREGSIRAIATARVLNEGIDVPDARVAIVVAGTLGEREHVQRIGRVLRPAPGKRALAYELVTLETVDARLAAAREAHAAAAPA